MLAATFQTAAFLFLLLVAVLVVAAFIAFTAPSVGKLSRPCLTTVLLYLAVELAALFFAVWLVVQVSELDLLPVLIALAIAAIVFAPQFVARIPLPAALTGFLGKR